MVIRHDYNLYLTIPRERRLKFLYTLLRDFRIYVEFSEQIWQFSLLANGLYIGSVWNTACANPIEDSVQRLDGIERICIYCR